ncbi:MAG TPA: hypothetical protein VFH08_13530 [Chitinophagaceae bacterium]|nr:hypothetical protein [Chitinophagaceae bacterium]
MAIGTKIKMIYRAIGALLSQSSLTLAFAEFHVNAGAWTFELKANRSYPKESFTSVTQEFIEENNLQYRVALITVHAEVSSLSNSGASIAAATGLPVITDLTALDIALGGNGEFYKIASEKLSMPGENLNELNKAICIAFMGILRWREEYNFLSSITGASRSSIGGAVWFGQEA